MNIFILSALSAVSKKKNTEKRHSIFSMCICVFKSDNISEVIKNES